MEKISNERLEKLKMYLDFTDPEIWEMKLQEKRLTTKEVAMMIYELAELRQE